MEFYDAIKTRHSVRSYTGETVPREALDRIAQAVSAAPSACNIQPWTFRVILNQDLRAAISSVYKAPWLAEAPAIVLCIGNKEAAWKRIEGGSILDMDIGIAMEHLVLAAAAEGLATCWICAFEVKKMSAVAGILPPWEVLAISPLGKARTVPQSPKRKEISELFRVIE